MKTIIVTGASKGIGLEVCRSLAKQGHIVYALARSTEQLVELSKEYPNHIISYSCDLTESAQIELFIESLGDTSIDALINNAGGLVNKPFLDLEISDWEHMLEINLLAVVRMVKALHPFMLPDSHIVNIGSMGGFQGSSKFPGLSAYSAAKGSLTILSECLATEFSDQRISVNCLCLGAVQTQMLEEAFPGYQAPLQADEMGGFISDFTLNGHRFFNGKSLPVALHNPG